MPLRSNFIEPLKKSLPFQAKDVIYLDDVRDSMRNSFKNGSARGTTTYFPNIDKRWTWRKGEVTLMHGLPNDGKSTMILQLMLIKSVREGVKWAVFSPESNPADDFYKDLIHTYIGKSTEPYYANQMTDAEFEKGMDFVGNHFFYLFPEDESPTPDYINDRFLEVIEKHGVEGVLTDPFNQLDNDWKKNGRDDLYISVYLSQEKRFALRHNVYKLIVAHPKGNPERDGQGNFKCPDQYSLSGGAMWFNKVDNMLATYRPFGNSNGDDPTVEFRSQKIKKAKLTGKRGTTILEFDLTTNRYYDEGKSPFEHINPAEPKKISIPASQSISAFETANDAGPLPF